MKQAGTTTLPTTLTASAISCLYQISRVMTEADLSVGQIVDRIVGLAGTYLGDRATLRITLSEAWPTMAGADYLDHPDNPTAPIELAESIRGEISLHYLERPPEPRPEPRRGGASRSAPPSLADEDRAFLEALADDLAGGIRQRAMIDELRESHRRQRIAQRVGHLALWEWDVTTDHWFWSDEAHHIFGADRDELGTRHEGFLDRVHPDDRSLVEDRLAAALISDVELSLDHRVTTLSGEILHVHLQGEVTLGVSDASTRMIGTLVDITERKVLERQLLQAQKMEAIGRLAGGVAHDFNNVLAVVLSFGTFVKESLTPGSPAADDMDEVLAAAKRAVGLTRQLLAFSRRQVTEPRIISINQHVLATDKMLRRLLGAHIELATIPAEDLWLTRIDPGHLEQILVNLAVNAHDAMRVGGKLTIETQNVVLDEAFVSQHEGASPGQHVMLAVSDDGIGMLPEVLEHVFEPFFTTKASGEGTGLGLATCYGIVKQAGGSIWVYSEVGDGTTVKVYLPRARGEVEEPTATAPPTATQGRGELVLVVEDDRGVRAVAVRTLRRMGYRVLEAENGEDALRVCAVHGRAIDLLVTDMVMPRLSGRELVARLATQCPSVRVLYMSGYTDNASVRGDPLPDNARFLQKPFMPNDLAAKVRETLDAPPHRM